MDSLSAIGRIAASGMRAQGERLKIVSENIANATTTGNSPGEDPYRRKTITFGGMMDRESGTDLVGVKDVGRDTSEFELRYDPAHPAANAEGYVKMPNVNALMEMANMREASRSFEANLNMFEAARAMRRNITDLLK